MRKKYRRAGIGSFRKKTGHRKGSRLRRLLLSLASALALLTGGAGGLEYYTTGSISRTLEALETVAEGIGEVSGRIGRWSVEQIFGRHGTATLEEIPVYQGNSYVELYGNIPSFSEEDRSGPAYEYYSELDWLGRCGYAQAKITRRLMPTQEREPIGQVRPSGWQTVKYKGIEGNYLYNRCHLIGYQLTGENANEKNLITGTRYLNVEGMLPWENLVADYIRQTGDAVLYRVTPVYEGNNLVASGVQMEAESLGSSQIRFNIYVFNVQPGIRIDYATGKSRRE